jgi:hypothetical protein
MTSFGIRWTRRTFSLDRTNLSDLGRPLIQEPPKNRYSLLRLPALEGRDDSYCCAWPLIAMADAGEGFGPDYHCQNSMLLLNLEDERRMRRPQAARNTIECMD